MKKKYLTLLAIGAVATSANAQLNKTDEFKNNLSIETKDTIAWVYSGVFTAGINQGFLHNWQAGGEVASIKADALFSGNLTRMYKKLVWSNSLDANYSLFYAYSNNFVPRKVDDRIDFTSKVGSRYKKTNIFLTGLFNMKSQFTKGYDYSLPNWDSMAVSGGFSPAYFTLALGAEYRQGTNLNVFFSPLAARITAANAQYTRQTPTGRFGIEYNKTTRFELGAYFSGRWQHNFSKNVLYKTRVDFYMNYLAKDIIDPTTGILKKDNPGNIDWLFDNLLQFNFGKHFAAAIAVTAIYDNDVPYVSTITDASGNVVEKDEPGTGLGWWQMKQIMTLGFTYKF